jgi:formylglycine-generating enzyme required for sulfatase activity
MLLPNEPLLGFIPIPKGKFLIGSDPNLDEKSMERERPEHELDIPYEYYVARYPVTVAQYRLFIEESKYVPSDEDSLKGTLNHPVVNVNWYDALEYCKWLDQNLKGLRVKR